ncbi:MAG: nitrous oxide reductase family maturation protein NosD [Bacteroidia bacterium]
MNKLKPVYIAICLSILAQQALCGTITVGLKNKFKTICSAINHSHTGDTILVENGIYRENDILINKSLYLKGVNQPVIDGETKHTIFIIRADSVSIEGFSLHNTGVSTLDDRAGIKILKSSYCTVKKNIFENTCFGSFLSNSSHCRISDNTFKGSAVNEVMSGGGVHMLHCDSCVISNNNVSGHRDGIYFEFVTNSLIEHNSCRDNIRYGLHFMFSDNNVYEDNIFQNNISGVAVMYSKHITMVGNTFRDNWGASSFGLYLKEITESIIKTNQFVRNTVGIDMEGVDNSFISGNNFWDNGWALKMVSDCNADTITGNNFENNSFDVGSYGGIGHYCFYKNYWDDYSGYDLNNDGIGDIPFQPVSLFSVIVQECPDAIILLKSFIIQILNSAESMVPVFTPAMEKDNAPLMKPIKIDC